MALPIVAIVGRPNVGKSTLFNRIIGFKKAIIDDTPGVTRDRNYEEADVFGHRFLLIDTGGIEPQSGTPLLEAMGRQVAVAIEEADVILFVVDGRAGQITSDSEVAEMLRRANKPVVLAVNKIDGAKHDLLENDFWSLGLDNLIGISAAHGRGVYDLLERVIDALPEAPEEVVDDLALIDDGLDEGMPRPLLIAVIGRPNIGKSTLINHLLGAERHVVDNAPGTTMDPVDSALEIDGNKYVLVDTAGVRRRQKIDTQLERFVSMRSIRSIERAHVCLLVIDGIEGPTDQDSKLAHLVEVRGRALIVLINKWDLAADLEDVNSRAIEDEMEKQLQHVSWAPHLFISAKTGKGVHRILPLVEKVGEQFTRRIPTSQLNRFLERTIANHTPPQKNNRPVRLYYATQHRVRPPTITFFANNADGVVSDYRRYISNRLRTEFGFEGTPLRIAYKARRREEKEG
jgi:GTP-binding protein